MRKTGTQGICRVVIERDRKTELSWDRYIRLNAAAEAVRKLGAERVLDAGGFDGALGFFLDGIEMDLIDPETTGGSILQIGVDDRAYDAVVAVDVLEHIEPSQRKAALTELARVANRFVVLNYPGPESKAAQEFILELTGNQLIRDHAEWDLPDSNWVLSELRKWGFDGTITKYASTAVWLGQYLAANLMPDVGSKLSRHLVDHHANEDTSSPLYHLVVCRRNSQ